MQKISLVISYCVLLPKYARESIVLGSNFWNWDFAEINVLWTSEPENHSFDGCFECESEISKTQKQIMVRSEVWYSNYSPYGDAT